ncbi:MAG: hypothetical protein SPI35_05925 [Porphyromonas sp.]|nr:hypothetical protein [Porphyromonas sp.]
MTDRLIEIGGFLISGGVLGSVFTYITQRKQRRNSFIHELQKSIDLLSDKNENLMRQVVALREQNIELLANQTAMKMELESLRLLYERETGRPAPRKKVENMTTGR